MEMAIDKARNVGVGIVVSFNSGHLGAVGHFAMLAFSCGDDSESESPRDEQVRVDEFPLLRGPLSPSDWPHARCSWSWAFRRAPTIDG